MNSCQPFHDRRLVNNAGLILPATLALHLGLPELVDRHLDLGDAPGRANTGAKIMTLVASAWLGATASTTPTHCAPAGRLTRSARRLTLHLPQRWPWETQFSRALARLRALPLPA